MNKIESKELIRYVFSNKFSEESYQKFVANLFKEYTSKSFQPNIKDSFKSFVNKYKEIGDFVDKEGNEIAILQVMLNTSGTLERARTAQRNFVANYLKNRGKEAALVAFISPKNPDWRLSLVKLEHSLEVVEEKLKTKEEITPAKRWSFLVGENEGSHTAQSRFVGLLVSDEAPNLSELELAFDIETVTTEFFNKYTQLYFRLKEHLDSLFETDGDIKKDFEEKEISTIDFAKKTLGQIVFLYFLQKKGWFGVAPNKKWGEGPKKFLRELFEDREKYGENFFNDILEPLFYEALAQDRGEESIYPRLNNCRMPFLNGGLFEPMNGYMWEITDIVIPDELFSNNNVTKEGDKGDGILDVFDRYNFTVNENEPLEKEVAVDPEMLGKVFENLLSIVDRKSKGAFYTPRAIVHYMCQESLINYLETETKKEILREDLELLIYKGDRIIENDEIALKRKEERYKKYGTDKYKDSTYSLLLPESVRKKADKLDQLLKDIKVADPAVGSGAFPLGMINEIVRARKVLNVYIKNKISDYDLKKYTITHSIYGVDIDPGAVDIAKLRLWLALVVDEETPHPLPNLEHKIMQGNSLVSEYEGIKLFDENLSGKEGTKQIEQLDLEFCKTKFESKIEELQSKIFLFIDESQKSKKQDLKKEIDSLKWEMIESSLEEQGQLDKLAEIQKLRRKNIRPFFVWKLEFSDVFKKKGGFDVVIGNPPYIKEYTDRNAFNGLRKSPYYMGKMDLWYFFACYGLDLLKTRGVQAFIAPNNWTSNFGAKLIREKLLNESVIHQFIDFGNYKVFDTAGIQTMVYILEKNNKNQKYEVKYARLNTEKPTSEELTYFLKGRFDKVNDNFEKYLFNFEKERFVGKSIQFLNSKIDNIIGKIKSGENIFLTSKEVANGIHPHFDFVGKKQKEKLDKQFKVGDGIFGLSQEEKKNLNLNDNEKELVKPYFMNPNFYKYGTNPENAYWIIYTDSKFKDQKKIRRYPNLKKHLDRFLKVITSDNKPYGLHRARDERFFQGEKIVVARKCIEPCFSYNDFDCYVSATFYVVKTDRVSTKYLLALFNSKVIRFWLRNKGKMQGNNFQIDKEPLLNIPIKEISSKKQVPFINLVDKILEISSEEGYDPKNPPIKQKEFENKIDEMVMELYDLSGEEKEIIRNS